MSDNPVQRIGIEIFAKYVDEGIKTGIKSLVEGITGYFSKIDGVVSDVTANIKALGKIPTFTQITTGGAEATGAVSAFSQKVQAAQGVIEGLDKRLEVVVMKMKELKEFSVTGKMLNAEDFETRIRSANKWIDALLMKGKELSGFKIRFGDGLERDVVSVRQLMDELKNFGTIKGNFSDPAILSTFRELAALQKTTRTYSDPNAQIDSVVSKQMQSLTLQGQELTAKKLMQEAIIRETELMERIIAVKRVAASVGVNVAEFEALSQRLKGLDAVAKAAEIAKFAESDYLTSVIAQTEKLIAVKGESASVSEKAAAAAVMSALSPEKQRELELEKLMTAAIAENIRLDEVRKINAGMEVEMKTRLLALSQQQAAAWQALGGTTVGGAGNTAISAMIGEVSFLDKVVSSLATKIQSLRTLNFVRGGSDITGMKAELDAVVASLDKYAERIGRIGNWSDVVKGSLSGPFVQADAKIRDGIISLERYHREIQATKQAIQDMVANRNQVPIDPSAMETAVAKLTVLRSQTEAYKQAYIDLIAVMRQSRVDASSVYGEKISSADIIARKTAYESLHQSIVKLVSANAIDKMSTMERIQLQGMLQTRLAETTALYQKNAISLQAANAAHAQEAAMLTQVNTLLGANAKKTGDALRATERWSATGFASMLQSQSAWMTGGALFFGILKTIKDAVASTIELENQMHRAFRTIMLYGDQTYTTLDQAQSAYSDKILQLIYTTGAKSKDVAEVLYQLGSAGMNATESLAGLEPTLRAIIATEGDIRETSKTIAGLYNNFKDTATFAKYGDDVAAKLTRINDVIIHLYKEYTIEMNELNDGFKHTVAVADATGISFEQLGSILAVLNQHMIKGGLAGRGFRSMMQRITQDSQGFADAINQAAGKHILDIDPKKPLDLMNIMKQLSESVWAGTLSTEQLGVAFQRLGLRGAPTLLTLVKYWGEVEQAQKRVAVEAEGATNRMSSIMINQMKGDFARAGEAITGIFRAMIIAPMAMMDTLAKFLNLLTSIFQALPGPFKEVVAFVGGLTLSAVALNVVFSILGVTAASIAAKFGLVAIASKVATLGISGLATASWAFIKLTPVGWITGLLVAIPLLIYGYEYFASISKRAMDDVSKRLHDLESQARTVSDIERLYQSKNGKLTSQEQEVIYDSIGNSLKGILTKEEARALGMERTLQILRDQTIEIKKQSDELAKQQKGLAGKRLEELRTGGMFGGGLNDKLREISRLKSMLADPTLADPVIGPQSGITDASMLEKKRKYLEKQFTSLMGIVKPMLLDYEKNISILGMSSSDDVILRWAASLIPIAAIKDKARTEVENFATQFPNELRNILGDKFNMYKLLYDKSPDIEKVDFIKSWTDKFRQLTKELSDANMGAEDGNDVVDSTQAKNQRMLQVAEKFIGERLTLVANFRKSMEKEAKLEAELSKKKGALYTEYEKSRLKDERDLRKREMENNQYLRDAELERIKIDLEKKLIAEGEAQKRTMVINSAAYAESLRMNADYNTALWNQQFVLRKAMPKDERINSEIAMFKTLRENLNNSLKATENYHKDMVQKEKDVTKMLEDVFKQRVAARKKDTQAIQDSTNAYKSLYDETTARTLTTEVLNANIKELGDQVKSSSGDNKSWQYMEALTGAWIGKLEKGLTDTYRTADGKLMNYLVNIRDAVEQYKDLGTNIGEGFASYGRSFFEIESLMASAQRAGKEGNKEEQMRLTVQALELAQKVQSDPGTHLIDVRWTKTTTAVDELTAKVGVLKSMRDDLFMEQEGKGQDNLVKAKAAQLDAEVIMRRILVQIDGVEQKLVKLAETKYVINVELAISDTKTKLYEVGQEKSKLAESLGFLIKPEYFAKGVAAALGIITEKTKEAEKGVGMLLSAMNSKLSLVPIKFSFQPPSEEAFNMVANQISAAITPKIQVPSAQINFAIEQAQWNRMDAFYNKVTEMVQALVAQGVALPGSMRNVIASELAGSGRRG